MKNIFPLFFIMSYAMALSAQGVFRNQTNGTLEKVIQDYPNQFKNLKGDLLASTAQAAEYKSVINIPGSVSTTVTQYTSDKKIVSWQTIVFTSTTFEEARNKFKEVYSEIKNTIVKLDGERPVILNGQYENPEEAKNNTTVYFDLLPNTASTQQIKVDLCLEKMNQQWKIVLSVYDKDRKGTDALAVF